MLDNARNYFANKRVLITGGCGFIGRHLASQLSRWEAKVRLFDLRKGCTGENEFVLGDIRDRDTLEQAIVGCDIVFHLAALLGVERISNIPLEVLDVNLRGTINALKAAERNNVKLFVFASSSEVYGEPRRIPVSEETSPSPISVYGISKLAAEAYCQAFAQSTGLKCVSLRFFNVYGPGQAEEFVVPRFVLGLAHGDPPNIYGAGKQVRAYTYIADAVRCTLLAASSEKAINEVFNVGSLEIVTVAQLARLAIEISGKCVQPVYTHFGDGIRPASREIYIRIPDTSKAERVLGFKSSVSIREGLTRTYEWYRVRSSSSEGVRH